MLERESTKQAVITKYAELALISTDEDACGCGGSCSCGAGGSLCLGPDDYSTRELAELPERAVAASLGCGNPLAVASLQEGETVLDLGSGGGIDVLLSARRVGPSGFAYGLDITDEMVDLSRSNAAEAGATNVEFLRGEIEDIPLPAASVDVVISNCAINLSTDKVIALAEASRVLRPGGRLAVTDIVADPDLDPFTRRDMEAWTGCLAGALTREEYRDLLAGAGFQDVEIEETHRVHPRAGSAIIRARKPGP
ncbi:MAG TPA: arsenite methyltransferase [Actinomycetota bacterium]|nr:arsenite methyltransferase [Actinomycetota bacterium]